MFSLIYKPGLAARPEMAAGGSGLTAPQGTAALAGAGAGHGERRC